MLYDLNGQPVEPSDGQQYAHIINRESPPQTNSRDVLSVAYIGKDDAGTRKSLHTYEVTNYSGKQISQYHVFFFLASDGHQILGLCDCVAWRLCKHIAAAWSIHVTAETSGFIRKIQTI